MAFEFKCGLCGSIIEGDDDHRGEEVQCPSCSKTIIVPLSNIVVGREFAGYRIDERLGTGAFGEVYRATHLTRNQEMAIKVLPAGGSRKQQEASERFLNEVNMMARLTHPNVVTAREAGAEGGYYFLAMDFVDGHDLMQRLDDSGPLPEEQALHIARDVVEALAYAWESFKVTHRDIKPDNIMIDKDGRTKLMDLGLSNSMYDEKDVLTKTGHVLGTPYYMSPEQIHGEELDWLSDEYSLGATLYNLVSGVPAYDGETCDDLLQNVISGDWRSPCYHNADISKPCEILLKHMMQKDKHNRYQSWADVREAIECTLKGKEPPPPMKNSRTATVSGIPASRLRNANRLQVQTDAERKITASGLLQASDLAEEEKEREKDKEMKPRGKASPSGTHRRPSPEPDAGTRPWLVVTALAVGLVGVVVLLGLLIKLSQ